VRRICGGGRKNERKKHDFAKAAKFSKAEGRVVKLEYSMHCVQPSRTKGSDQFSLRTTHRLNFFFL
jgi:hypothetical protein